MVAGPTPTIVALRPNAGSGGSDRVELIWADNAIQKTWLEVTVQANSDTGLTAPYSFFFGNALGDDGVGDTTSAFTNATDDVDARNHPGSLVPVTGLYDYNRDGFVNSTDSLIAQNNTGFIRFINIAGIAQDTTIPNATPAMATAASTAPAGTNS